MADRGSPKDDAVYYRDGARLPGAMSVLTRARLAMFALFMREMRPGATTTVLDIGVSDEENQGANVLEKHFPNRGNLTCAGLGEGKAVRAAYPEVAYRQITPNAPLPFADQSFDIACSNAVIEHVGGPAARVAFLKEHLRVARNVFLTFPNRWFPIEHHTGLPFLHYAPSLFRRLLRGTRFDDWTRIEALDFLDRGTVLREWPLAEKPRLVMTGLSLGPFSSNVAVIFRRQAPDTPQ